MIRVEDLYKAFAETEVLRGASLSVNKGEVMALIGRSGCGKSVLLKHIAGLFKPDQGRVFVDGNDMTKTKGKALMRVRDRLGYLFQSGALFDSMTVFENVAFPLKEKTDLKEDEIKEKVLYELNELGLIGSEDKYPSQISGGMIRRASLARALVEEPEIMLFDEPTTGLDPVTGESILTLIDACHKRVHFTGIIVTHEIPKIFVMVDRVAMLHDGVVLFEGSSEEIMAATDPEVRRFIHGSISARTFSQNESGLNQPAHK